MRQINECKAAVLAKISKIIENEWPKQDLDKFFAISITCTRKSDRWREQTLVYIDPEVQNQIKNQKETD